MYNNFYTDTGNNLYNPLKSQFDTAMQREQKTITKYFDNTSIPVLFRKNQDKNTTKNRTTIFYYADADLQQGQLIKYKNDTYIVINQESGENDCYLRSDLLKCNTYISTFSNGQELYIPVYNGDLLGALPDENKVLTTLNGYCELITEDNPTIRNLKLSATFDSLGHTFKVANYLYKDGMTYIYTEQTSTPQKQYTIEIETPAATTFTISTTAQLTATCKYGEETVTNPTLKWSSSNPAIATISDNGQALFLAEGSVSFACLWTEHNLTDTILATVQAQPIPTTNTAIISGRDSIKIGGSARPYTASFTDSIGNPIELTPDWDVEIDSTLEKYIEVTYPTAMTCSIKALDYEGLLGEQIKLILTDTENTCQTEKLIDLVIM